MNAPDQWMTMSRGAEYLGISRWTLQRRVRERSILPDAPRRGDRRAVWFLRSTLDRARREGRV